MGKRTRKSQKSGSNLRELVVAAAAQDLEQAKDYEAILKNNDIPAIIKEQRDDSAGGAEYVVMVPEELVDEAHVVIESQDAYDDFYDFALDDETEEDLESDIFDDEP